MATQLGSHSNLSAWSLVNTVLPSMGMPVWRKEKTKDDNMGGFRVLARP